MNLQNFRAPASWARLSATVPAYQFLIHLVISGRSHQKCHQIPTNSIKHPDLLWSVLKFYEVLWSFVWPRHSKIQFYSFSVHHDWRYQRMRGAMPLRATTVAPKFARQVAPRQHCFNYRFVMFGLKMVVNLSKRTTLFWDILYAFRLHMI